MRPSIVLVLSFLIACSSGREERAGRDASARRRADASAPERATADGGGSEGPATTWGGTFRGESDIPDGGLPDGSVAWRGEGTLRLEVRGETVTGSVTAEGVALAARGNLAGGKLRAWLRSTGQGGRVEGVLVGDLQDDRLAGTWRTSAIAGDDVRAGRFEARR